MSEMNIQQIQTTFIQLLQNMFHFEENVEIEQFNEDPNQTNEENFQQGESIWGTRFSSPIFCKTLVSAALFMCF